jgi:hypothetical protein
MSLDVNEGLHAKFYILLALITVFLDVNSYSLVDVDVSEEHSASIFNVRDLTTLSVAQLI